VTVYLLLSAHRTVILRYHSFLVFSAATLWKQCWLSAAGWFACDRVGRVSCTAWSRPRHQLLCVGLATGRRGEHRNAVCRHERHRRQLVPLRVPRRLSTHRKSYTRLQLDGTLERLRAVVYRQVSLTTHFLLPTTLVVQIEQSGGYLYVCLSGFRQ